MARGGFNLGGANMQQLMKEAQRMQDNMAKAKDEVDNSEFEATVGGGVVKAVVYGRKELKSIEINPECVDPDDVEMLQDLIIGAVNEALRSADEAMNTKMAKFTGGMNLGF